MPPPAPSETITSQDGKFVYDVYSYFDTFPSQTVKTRAGSPHADREINMQIAAHHNYGAFVVWQPTFSWGNLKYWNILPWAAKYTETCFRSQSPAECRANLRPTTNFVQTFIRRES